MIQSAGKYDIQGIIGEGGMGVVYKAVHRETGEIVALKTVLVPSKMQLSSLRREIYTLAEVNHPGIVKIKDEGLKSGIPWYAMELLEGSTLREVLDTLEEEDSYSVIEVLNIIRQVCLSIAYLHGQGILHLDLKPENIFITRDGTPKLMDFGLVSRFMSQVGREASELGQYGVGTLEYMAPELILGQSVDARADLYSIGSILYETIAGQTPYPASDVAMIIRQQFEVGYPPLSDFVEDIPETLLALIDRLLQVVPEKRMGFARDVAAALDVDLPDSPGFDALPEPRSYLYRSGFVGRAGIIEQLNVLIRNFQNGNGAMVILGGEAGIGKTRLAMEIGRQIQSLNSLALVGSCQSTPGTGEQNVHSDLFQALKKPLMTLYDFCRDKGPAGIRSIIGERDAILAYYGLSPLGTSDSENPISSRPVPAAQARVRLFRILSQLFCAFADLEPFVLILDDLQWADELTLGFLKYLADSRKLNHRGLLVVCTYRMEDAQWQLRDLLGSRGVSVMNLKGLEDKEVGAMVRDMLALQHPAPAFYEYLSRHSSGNPFFVAEYLSSAVEEGLLYRNSIGEWCVRSGDQIRHLNDGGIHVPSSLREILINRIHRLPSEFQRFIEVFSVMGREVDARILKDLTGRNEVDIMVCLQELLTRQVISETEPGRFRFIHDQMRIVVYESIAQERLAPLHLRAVEILKRTDTGSRMKLFGEMAYHTEKAMDLSSASSLYLSSARLAIQSVAVQEAKKLYDKYFDLQAGNSPEILMVRLEYCRNVLSVYHNIQDLSEVLYAVLSDARKIGYKKAEADALSQLSAIVWRLGDAEEAWAMGMAALNLYRQRQDRRSEAETLNNMGQAAVSRGEHFKALASFQQALDIYRTLEDRGNESGVLADLGMVYLAVGKEREGIKLMNQSLSMQKSAGDDSRMGRTYECLAEAAQKANRVAQAIQYLEKAMKYHRKLLNRAGEGRVLAAISTLYHQKGENEKAVISGEKAIGVFLELGDDRAVAGIQFRFAEFEIMREQYSLAREHFEGAMTIFDELNDLERKGKSLRYISRIIRWTDDSLTDADALAHEADCIFRKLGNIIEIVDCLKERTFVALARGISGREYYEEAMNLVNKNYLSDHPRCRLSTGEMKKALICFNSGRDLIHGESLESIHRGEKKY